MSITVRTLSEEDLPALDRLLQQYILVYPPRTAVPAQFYLSPYFDGGQKVQCAFDEQGLLVGYAPYMAQGLRAWVEVMAWPGLEGTAEVKEALWGWIMDQARQGGQEKLCFQYYPNEDAAIQFAEEHGGKYCWSIFSMRRDLSLPIPALPMPDGYVLRCWRMESEAEQRQYLEGRNICFPEAPTSLDEWQYFTSTPLWNQGINMAAFAGERLAASVLVYWQPESTSGVTDYVFTLAEFRGHGLARVLLAEALNYLKMHGLQYAVLEVKAENRAALGVYAGMGYEVEGETMVYEVDV